MFVLRWLRTLTKRFDRYLRCMFACRRHFGGQRQRTKTRLLRRTTELRLEAFEQREMLSVTPVVPLPALQPVVYQASPPPISPAAALSNAAAQLTHLIAIIRNDVSSIDAVFSQEVTQMVAYKFQLLKMFPGERPSDSSQPLAASMNDNDALPNYGPSSSADNGLPAPQTSGLITPLVLSPPSAHRTSLAATSGVITPMVGGSSIGTTSQLSSSSNPSYPGQSVTFTDVVSGGASGGGPTGTVDLTDGQTDLGSSSLQVVNGQTEASWTISILALGSHSLTATYGGDSNYGGSSASLTQTVNQISTTTQLTSSVNPSMPNQAVTLTAIVSNNASGGGTPTGTVLFEDAGTELGSSSLSVVNGQDEATWTVDSFSLGSHALTATYSGDNVFLGSTATLTQNVNQANSWTTLISSANPSMVGQSVTFTAVVSGGASGGGTPAGTMTFLDGSTELSSSPLTVVNGQDEATWTTSALALGSHQISAQYSGDSNFLASSATIQQNVSQGSSGGGDIWRPVPNGDYLWSDPQNWSSGMVPENGATATFDGGYNSKVIVDVATTQGTIILQNGYTAPFEIEGGAAELDIPEFEDENIAADEFNVVFLADNATVNIKGMVTYDDSVDFGTGGKVNVINGGVLDLGNGVNATQSSGSPINVTNGKLTFGLDPNNVGVCTFKLANASADINVGPNGTLSFSDKRKDLIDTANGGAVIANNGVVNLLGDPQAPNNTITNINIPLQNHNLVHVIGGRWLFGTRDVSGADMSMDKGWIELSSNATVKLSDIYLQTGGSFEVEDNQETFMGLAAWTGLTFKGGTVSFTNLRGFGTLSTGDIEFDGSADLSMRIDGGSTQSDLIKCSVCTIKGLTHIDVVMNNDDESPDPWTLIRSPVGTVIAGDFDVVNLPPGVIEDEITNTWECSVT